MKKLDNPVRTHLIGCEGGPKSIEGFLGLKVSHGEMYVKGHIASTPLIIGALAGIGKAGVDVKLRRMLVNAICDLHSACKEKDKVIADLTKSMETARVAIVKAAEGVDGVCALAGDE